MAKLITPRKNPWMVVCSRRLHPYWMVTKRSLHVIIILLPQNRLMVIVKVRRWKMGNRMRRRMVLLIGPMKRSLFLIACRNLALIVRRRSLLVLMRKTPFFISLSPPLDKFFILFSLRSTWESTSINTSKWEKQTLKRLHIFLILS